jgi:signal transduction histidine kinase
MKDRRRRPLLAVFAALVCVGPFASAAEPLTTARSILDLSREAAKQAVPVMLKGIVVYSGWDAIVVHDGQASVYADFHFAREKGIWQEEIPGFGVIPPGTVVEVEGVTDPGGFSPMVLVKSYRALGTEKLPEPARPTLEELLSGAVDTQWVEVEGIARRLEKTAGQPQSLTLLVGGHPCPVLLRRQLRRPAEHWVDARVRVRGVLLSIANLRSQASGMRIHASGASAITILSPPPKDPFLAPKVDLDKLIAFHPDADVGHRRVGEGVVTLAVPGKFFFVRGQEASVRVNSRDTTIAAGDRVEFAGFIDTTRILAGFSEAIVRKVGVGTVPPPAEPMISEILAPATRSAEEMVLQQGHADFNGRVIRLEGLLRGVLPADGDGTVTLVIESGNHVVRAFLPAPLPDWTLGSLVELTGVCELEISRTDRLPWFSIDGFHVWLSSPSGLRVLAEPPWWTPARLGILLATVALGLGVALAWGYSMRRQVALRGGQLAAEIAARESAQLEFDTVLRERRRLASDLHDTLEQSLVGLALQLEIATRASDLTKREHHLALARQFLERSRAEVHRTVWDLHAHGQAGREFREIIEERVTSMADGTGVAITLHAEAGQGRPSDLIAGHLLLLVQEAVTNALKHSGASAIGIEWRLSSADAELVVEDNGCGFEPSLVPGQRDGHFGLQGMRERVKRLGGQVEIRTAPGHGTTISVRIPLPDSSD